MKIVLGFLLVVSFLASPTLAEGLEEVLPGTWNFISSSPTEDGTFELIEPTKIYWTLNADGSGKYYRKINQFNAARVHDELRWSVKGKTLTLDGDLHFTIVDWDESQMTWLNPGKTQFIRLEKQK